MNDHSHPSDDPADTPEPRPETASRSTRAGFYAWVDSLRVPRSTDRWLGGVVAGVADRIGMDRNLARGLYAVLTLLTGGLALLVYGVAWALLPEPDGRIHLREAAEGRWSSGMTGVVVLAALGVMDVFTGGTWRGGWWGVSTVLGLGVIGLFTWLVLSRRPGGPRGALRYDRGTDEDAERAEGSVFLTASNTDWYLHPDQQEHDRQHHAARHWDAEFRGEPVPDGGGSSALPSRSDRPLPGSVQAAVVGLALVIAALLPLLRYEGIWPADWSVVWAAALASALGVLALGVIAGALAGRSGGGLTVATIVLVVPVIATTGGVLGYQQVDVGRLSGNPATGYEASFDTGVIDLTGLEAADGDRRIPLDLSFATTEVLLPDDVDVYLVLDSSFSSVEYRGLDGSDVGDPDQIPQGSEIQLVDAPGDTTVHLDADLSFSTLTLTGAR